MASAKDDKKYEDNESEHTFSDSNIGSDTSSSSSFVVNSDNVTIRDIINGVSVKENYIFLRCLSKRNVGKLIILLMTDLHHDQIKTKIFHQEHPSLGPVFKENKVFKLKRFETLPVNENYRTIIVPTSREIVCNRFTEVEQVDDTVVPVLERKYTKISDWKKTEPNTLAGNICAVIINKPKPSKRIINGKTHLMMDLVLLDNTNSSCFFTLWNANAEKFERKCHPGDMIKINDVFHKIIRDKVYIVSIDISKISVSRQSTSKTLIPQLRGLQQFWCTYGNNIISQYNDHQLSTMTRDTSFIFNPPPNVASQGVTSEAMESTVTRETRATEATVTTRATRATKTTEVTGTIPRKHKDNTKKEDAKLLKKKQNKRS